MLLAALFGGLGHASRLKAVQTCTERNPPIEEVIAQNVIPRFVQFLQRNDPQLQVCRCQLKSQLIPCKHLGDTDTLRDPLLTVHTSAFVRSLRRPGR